MNTEKIIGYLLLIAGIGVIIASSFSLYFVFTGQKKAPRVFSFKMPGITLPSQQSFKFEVPEGMSLPEGFSLPENLSSETGSEDQELKLLPDEPVNDLVNMGTYLLLMSFIASTGVKIAGIGVKMIKEIKVVVKEEKIKPLTQSSS